LFLLEYFTLLVGVLVSKWRRDGLHNIRSIPSGSAQFIMRQSLISANNCSSAFVDVRPKP
jgi:hypothetical protein